MSIPLFSQSIFMAMLLVALIESSYQIEGGKINFLLRQFFTLHIFKFLNIRGINHLLLYHYCLDEGGLSLDRILRGKGGSCRERLPNKMNKIRSCKSLELACQKLKNKCHKNLGNAIRNSEDGRRCRYVLGKTIYRQRVNALCSLTCGKCGKYNLEQY